MIHGKHLKYVATALSLVFVVACLSMDAEERFGRGMEMFYDGKYEDAESHFLALARDLGREKEDGYREVKARALFQAGRIEHLYLGQPRRAVARLREALKLDPEAPFALEAQKEIAFIFHDRLRDYRTAALEFERLVNTFPDKQDIVQYRYRIAQSYFMLREFDQARAETRLILQNQNSDRFVAEAMLLVANSYYVEGRYQEAADAHLELLEIGPEEELESRSRFELGMCYQELRDYKKAERNYLEALEKHPRPDLVKVQLESLQRQMRQEEGDNLEQSPYSKRQHHVDRGKKKKSTASASKENIKKPKKPEKEKPAPDRSLESNKAKKESGRVKTEVKTKPGKPATGAKADKPPEKPLGQDAHEKPPADVPDKSVPAGGGAGGGKDRKQPEEADKTEKPGE